MSGAKPPTHLISSVQLVRDVYAAVERLHVEEGRVRTALVRARQRQSGQRAASLRSSMQERAMLLDLALRDLVAAGRVRQNRKAAPGAA